MYTEAPSCVVMKKSLTSDVMIRVARLVRGSALTVAGGQAQPEQEDGG